MINRLLFCSAFLLLQSLNADIVPTEIKRDPASNQMLNYKGTQTVPLVVTTSYGTPVDDKANSMTAGPLGPIVLQDNILLDELQHFNRERIPERVVHAKGAGAFGFFEVTHDITQYSKASIFGQIGKRTPLVVRFSTVGGETGSADTVRDPRGFSIKFYTDEGIWDLVCNNTPIFFIRDPMLFPSFIHTQKRNPVTHLKDRDMFWDFLTLRPESTHQVMILFSDRGIPDGFRHMHGYGSNTFKLVNAHGEAVYCKFHLRTNQGIRNLPVDRAAQLASSDPDYATRDLYNAIASGNFPSWNFSIQVMTFKQAEQFKWNPFDVTKVWPQKEFPLIPVGRLALDRNPRNYFTDVEQATFNPAHMVPGVEPSPDKMLQGRLFAYSDAHLHRTGVNSNQLPVNNPFRNILSNTHRDGLACYGDNQDGAPNYIPNSFSAQLLSRYAAVSSYPVSGDVKRYNTSDDDNFSQPSLMWNLVLTDEEKQRLVDNLVDSIKDASSTIQARAIKNFHSVDPVFGSMVAAGLEKAALSV